MQETLNLEKECQTKVAEIFESINKINYGWQDNRGNKHDKLGSNFRSDYILQTPAQTIESGVGICWDQVELERYYFEKNNIDCETYFIVYYDQNKHNDPSHTFLTFEDAGKYYWFEHPYGKYRGVHQYESKNELLFDVRNKFLNDDFDVNDDRNLCMYKYTKPEFGISVPEFYAHCASGENIQDFSS